MKLTYMPRAKMFLVALLALLCSVVGVQPRNAFAQSSNGTLFVPFLAGDSMVGDSMIEVAGVKKDAVYVLTNQPEGNAVAVYSRGTDGLLSMTGSVPTGGLGTGSGLGSQGAIMLSENGRWLFAVNAGSDELSVFEVHPSGIVLKHKVPSGGDRPTSVSNYKDLVYVLNAGDPGNITGFRLSDDGQLTPLAGSTRHLSNAGSGAAPAPAQVAFDPKGQVLVVTERATQLIDTYTVGADGLATGPVAQPSAGVTPFGFAFTQQGTLVVSEAFGGAVDGSAVSSYSVTPSSFQVISSSVATGETAACWVAVSKNGKYAYAANAGSASVSSYAVAQDGSITLLNGEAGLTGDGTGPVDLSMSHNSQFLYVLSARSQNVIGFAVHADGSLTNIGTFGGLPMGSAGIAVH